MEDDDDGDDEEGAEAAQGLSNLSNGPGDVWGGNKRGYKRASN